MHAMLRPHATSRSDREGLSPHAARRFR